MERRTTEVVVHVTEEKVGWGRYGGEEGKSSFTKTLPLFPNDYMPVRCILTHGRRRMLAYVAESHSTIYQGATDTFQEVKRMRIYHAHTLIRCLIVLRAIHSRLLIDCQALSVQILFQVW